MDIAHEQSMLRQAGFRKTWSVEGHLPSVTNTFPVIPLFFLLLHGLPNHYSDDVRVENARDS